MVPSIGKDSPPSPSILQNFSFEDKPSDENKSSEQVPHSSIKTANATKELPNERSQTPPSSPLQRHIQPLKPISEAERALRDAIHKLHSLMEQIRQQQLEPPTLNSSFDYSEQQENPESEPKDPPSPPSPLSISFNFPVRESPPYSPISVLSQTPSPSSSSPRSLNPIRERVPTPYPSKARVFFPQERDGENS